MYRGKLSQHRINVAEKMPPDPADLRRIGQHIGQHLDDPVDIAVFHEAPVGTQEHSQKLT